MKHARYGEYVVKAIEHNLKLIPCDSRAGKEKEPGCGWAEYKNLDVQNYTEYEYRITKANIAIMLTGKASSNLCVLDFDKFDSGYVSANEFLTLLSFPLPAVVKSGGGGIHLYFYTESPKRGGVKARLPLSTSNDFSISGWDGILEKDVPVHAAIELKATGQYVLMPYSGYLSKSGEQRYYEIVSHATVDDFFDAIPTLNDEQFEELLQVASLFHGAPDGRTGVKGGIRVASDWSARKSYEMNESTPTTLAKDNTTIGIPWDAEPGKPISWFNRHNTILDILLHYGYKPVRYDDSAHVLYMICPESIAKHADDTAYQNVMVDLKTNRSLHFSPSDLCYVDEHDLEPGQKRSQDPFSVWMEHEYLAQYNGKDYAMMKPRVKRELIAMVAKEMRRK